jgi:plastocyanin
MKKIFQHIAIVLMTLVSWNSFGQNIVNYDVILRSNYGYDTLWDGTIVFAFGMTPTLSAPVKIPARTLYCNEGDSVVITARSISQGEHHTIHLHGLDVDTRNDGDPSTSFWLNHMQDTTYSFKARYAGTYIYHCHVADVVHVQMGMYGLIVVKAAGGAHNAWTGGPAYNKDYKWLMSEIDKDWHDNIPVHDANMDTVNLPVYDPAYFLVNGKSQQQIANDDSIKITGSVNEQILVRMANIGYYNNKVVFPASLNAKIIDSDGRPLPMSISSDTVYMAPGERYSVMLTPSVQFTGNVMVYYQSMNTLIDEGVENIPVNINGFFSVDEENEEDKLSLFPNPVNDQLHLYRKKITDDQNFIITDITGKIMIEGKLRGENTEVNTSFWKNGVYLVKAGFTTLKFIVNK